MISLADRVVGMAIRKFESYCSLTALRKRLMGKITCLLYHRIALQNSYTWIEKGGVPANSPRSFEQHLQFLNQLKVRYLTLRDIAKGHFPESNEIGIVITFDDGFADNFRTAIPILDRNGARAVFFTTTDLIESDELLWDHQVCWHLQFPHARELALKHIEEIFGRPITQYPLEWTMRHLLEANQIRRILAALDSKCEAPPSRLPKDLYCDWHDLRNAIRGGHEIASHTVTHSMRYGMSSDSFVTELVQSKRVLEEGLQSEISSFSYPFNAYTFTDADLCRASGYQVAATVDTGRLTKKSSLFEVPRRTVFRPHDLIRVFRELLSQERW